MPSSSELLVPVGWQDSATCRGLHGVEHLQIEGTDVTLVLGSGSRQLWTQPECLFRFIPSDAEVTGIPASFASVAAFIFDGEVALAPVP